MIQPDHQVTQIAHVGPGEFKVGGNLVEQGLNLGNAGFCVGLRRVGQGPGLAQHLDLFAPVVHGLVDHDQFLLLVLHLG